MARTYQVISADSHLEIAPERWTCHVPAKYRDRAPRLVRLADGTDAIAVENRPLQLCPIGLVGDYEERWPLGNSYERAAGAGSPEQRLREQDEDGVDAEILFGAFGGGNFYRGIRDDDAYRSMIRAYNEFLMEDYCAAAPDRLLAMGAIPETGVEDAVAEMEYCAKRGFKGVTLNAFPSGKSYSSLEDDRFWATALDLRMPLTVHVNFGFPGGSGPVFKYAREAGELPSSAQNLVGRMAKFALRGGLHATQLTMAGVFDRFPNLQIYFAENQIGWIPNFFDQMDDFYGRHRYWAERLLGLEPRQQPPSETIREHCWWGFMANAFGVRVRHEIGVNRVMWATDFPHPETDWPRSREVIDEIFSGVPEDEKRLMIAGNAIEYFHLDSATR